MCVMSYIVSFHPLQFDVNRAEIMCYHQSIYQKASKVIIRRLGELEGMDM